MHTSVFREPNTIPTVSLKNRKSGRFAILDQEALPFASGWSSTPKPSSSSMPSALAVFTCRPNSHPFQERHVYLDEPVKIGRSVARCRPAQNNATFDCKVLSRNHALVWFDHKTGKVSRVCESALGMQKQVQLDKGYEIASLLLCLCPK